MIAVFYNMTMGMTWYYMGTASEHGKIETQKLF
jgi:hypothetical protein